MDTITIIAIFGALATIVLFFRGFMATANSEITISAAHTPPYIVRGKKAIVIGMGMIGASVFMGLAFYFGVTTRSLKEPLGYLILGAFASLMIGLFISIFVEGTTTKK